jgi:hypothetical protein
MGKGQGCVLSASEAVTGHFHDFFESSNNGIWQVGADPRIVQLSTNGLLRLPLPPIGLTVRSPL